ncbi:MAG: DUF2147 domain-containing protein [Hyphomicrobiaceae bacterium]
MFDAKLKVLALGLATLASTAQLAAATGDPTGVWIDDTGRGAVEIATCGNGSELCGRVVWVKSEKDRKGCGEQIIGNVKASSGGTWSGGWIFDPERGRKYDVELKAVGADKLRVMGYAGIRMFSETYYWKRAPADLERCDSQQQVAAAPAYAAGETTTGSLPAAAAGATAATVAVATAAVAAGSANRAPAPAYADDATDDEPRGKKRGGGLGDVTKELGKYVKRTAGGTCKVKTPWGSFKFDCKNI